MRYRWPAVLDYFACVRGILDDGQGGPLRPPGLRMGEARGEVRESLQKCRNKAHSTKS